MDCGNKILQILIFVFNFIFFLTGIAVIVIGSLVTADEEAYIALINTGMVQVSILLIVVGCIIVVVTFFGCCGAMKQSKCMLYTFSALLCLIFICEFGGGIAAFVYRADIKQEVTTDLISTMKEYGTDEEITKEWDNMQDKLECCGANNYTDWVNSGTAIPSSCCTDGDTCSTVSPYTDIYQQGCIPAVIDELDDNAVLIGGIACGLAFVEILGIMFACCFASDIH